MRINGLAMLVDRAVRLCDDPQLTAYRSAIILGSLREDVSYVPILGRVLEHWSLSHFYGPPWPGGFVPLLTPGARLAATYYFRKAVRAYRAGRVAAGYVLLGRVTHLLSDMACPVHVHRYIHDTDTFEWYVEAHVEELAALPVGTLPKAGSPAALIASMASFTAQFPGDPSQHLIGRALRRRGLLRGLATRQVAEQARAIIPVAVAHMAALLHLYTARTRNHRARS